MSHALAHQTKIWRNAENIKPSWRGYKDLNEPPKLVLNVDDMRETIEYYDDLYAKSEQLLQESGQDYLFLRYEDITGENKEKFLNSIYDFLGVERVDGLTSRHKKLNPRNLRDLIANFDEVERALKATEYEAMLYDTAH